MALQVWLPLTKDLRQQGLSSVAATNNGATYSSTGGKLGGCYNFDGTNDFLETSFTFNSANYSFCCWAYFTKFSVHLMDLRNPEASAGEQPMYVSSTGVQVGGTGSSFVYINYAFSTETWYHIAVTANSNEQSLYVNGNFVGSTTSAKGYNYNTTYPLRIATRCSGLNYFGGKINDVRAYDHCLSPLEIKYIAQGLILHYPLNRNGWGQENLTPCGGAYTQSSPWTTTLNRTDGYAFVTNSAFEATPGQTYTISVQCDGTLSSGHSAGSIPVADKPWTFWAYVCNTDTTKNWQTGGYDAAINLNSTNNNYRKIGNTYVWTITLSSTQKYISLRTNSYSDGTTNLTINWWNMKVEEGSVFTPWSPYGLTNTTEYDASGFCYNSEKNGTLTYTSDTPKYAVSTYFADGNTDYITGSIFMPTDQITISTWVRGDGSTAGANSYHIPLCMGSGYAEFSVDSSKLYRQGFYINGTRYCDTISGAIVNDGNWHMMTATYDGIAIRRYLDGTLINSREITGTLNGGVLTLLIGKYYSGGYNSKKFQQSDFRIYATALSAADVKSLYQNCATIDPDGTIRGQIRS